jgi:hypothetical protein
MAILVGVGCLVAATGAPHAQSAFRSRTDVVVIDAAVTDGRNPVIGLTKDDFELRDNGVLQQILDVGRETMPLDVTITIDVSGSMTPAERVVIERAIGTLSSALRPDDRGGVVTFSSRIAERVKLQRPPIRADLSPLGQGTAVVDALLLSLVSAPVVDRRRFGLFMTDGEENASSFDAATVVETARHASGQTSILVVRDRGRAPQRMEDMFRHVAETTGGELIRLGPGDDLSRGFLTALENFRLSYVLRYSPDGTPAAGWHNVAVKVKSRNYNVRARRGYSVPN